MHIAVEGCCHGELDAIYASVARAEVEQGVKVDLLLICGDFQALRNEHDFESLAVPAKFRALGSFHSYYSGQKVAPMLTIIIGGNHEASNYMYELFHGGWIAPNMYYLGNAGSVLVNGLRVSGASGIYKSHDYRRGFFETIPYDRSTMRSIYHIRHHSVSKLLHLPPSSAPSLDPSASSPSPFPPLSDPSIFLSHDWPLTIASSPCATSDLPALLRRKPFFADEIRDSTLGSKPLLEVLRVLKPEWWFAAHLHVKFAAVWRHDRAPSQSVTQEPQQSVADVGEVVNPDEIMLEDDDEDEEPPHTRHSAPANPDEIALDDDDESAVLVDAAAVKVEAIETKEVVDAAVGKEDNPDEIMLDAEDAAPASEPPSGSPVPSSSAPSASFTKFLALDKCLPNKDYLQILEVPTPVTSTPGASPTLTYDPHWLAITRAFHPLLSLSPRDAPYPPAERLTQMVADQMVWVTEHGLGFAPDGKQGAKEILQVQRFWKTAPAQGEPGGGPAAWYTNPQTVAFCDLLEIPNRINPFPPGFVPPPLPWLAQDQAKEAEAEVKSSTETTQAMTEDGAEVRASAEKVKITNP